MYSISMLEAQASGLFVVQKLDPENVCQIKDGINGKVFTENHEFGEMISKIKNLTSSERTELKRTVRDSVKDRNADTIARYLLDLYALAIERRKKGITYRQLREDNE